jgi:hypothetical protein
MIKTRSENAQWFHPNIIPNKHYIEVNPDSSDLGPILENMAKNPKDYLGIAEESTNWVMKNALTCHIELWIVNMLREYSTKLSFKLTQPSLPEFDNHWQQKPTYNTNYMDSIRRQYNHLYFQPEEHDYITSDFNDV